MAQQLRLMFVYAHPADTATEASGTAALHADRGDFIATVICSDGERHHNDIFLADDETPGRRRKTRFVRANLEQIKAMKRREARRVADIIGSREVLFLGWEDDYTTDLISGDRVRQLADTILELKPDVIVTHIPVTKSRRGDPHARIGQMVLNAVSMAKNFVRQVDGVAPHQVKEMFYFPMGGEVPETRDLLYDDIVPDVWIDITQVVDRKVRAIDQLATQSYQGARARKILETRDGWRGTLAGVSYAECFVRGAGVVYDSLPMPPSVLNRKLVASGLAADAIIAHQVPGATRDDAFNVPPEDSGTSCEEECDS